MVVDDDKEGFIAFLERWNTEQGMATPALHRDMADWLEARWRAGSKELLLLAFRDSGKSTLVGLFCAWLLYLDANRRVMVLAADNHLAKKMVRTVKRIVERHPLCLGMKPAKPELWGAEEFAIARDKVGRDPSMQAKGITANVTGSHADIVVCDDVEVPNTCDTAEKRSELRERLAEIAYVLSPGGTQLYIGTPHSFQSIYSLRACVEEGEEAPLLDGFERLEKPVYQPDGSSAWPERFSLEAIERIRRRSPVNKFISQMLLTPVSLEDGRLDADKLVAYDWALERPKLAKPDFRLGPHRLRTLRVWWDPALGLRDKKRRRAGDGSVAVLLGEDGEGRFFIHRALYLTVPKGSELAAGEAQCRELAIMVAETGVGILHLEVNGVGAFLPETLRKVLKERGLSGVSVIEERSTRPKVDRILGAIDAPLHASLLYAHDSVVAGPLGREMREWRPRGRGHDDGLDALAGAIAACARQRPDHTTRAGPVMAQTDFDPLT
ncbi:phage terminase large subunit [Niveispirillum sp. KHB5.9]|uniref:phage terminase large subunit n=1 Tax=Niveispirillum sp. KHB5.9 TaxID=3400269 RepID=UPI003A897629